MKDVTKIFEALISEAAGTLGKTSVRRIESAKKMYHLALDLAECLADGELPSCCVCSKGLVAGLGEENSAWLFVSRNS